MSPSDETSATYRLNKSLVKGLALLTEMNRNPNASGTISELAKSTGLHRTTVKRLLETLKQAGYVEHDLANNIYKLTFRVQQLSYGYRDTTLATEVAWPHMRTLSQKIVWPCSLVAPEGDEMVVRTSTRPYSRLSFHPGMPGRRMPMLTTAAGRAYLAYTSEAARQTILNMLGNRPVPGNAAMRDSRFIKALIDQTRSQGYGSNFGEWDEEPKFGAYAVPICNTSGEAIVSLNVIFLTFALKEAGTKEKLLEALFDAAKRIEVAYAESSARMPDEPGPSQAYPDEG